MSCFFTAFGLIVVVQSLSHVWLCDPWTAELQSSLSSTISRNLLKLMSVESKMPCNHLILYRPLLLLLSILLSIRVFSNELAVWIRCLKYWSFSSVSSVQSLSRVRFFATPWTAAPGSLSITISWSLLKLMSIESVMPSNHLILCHPLLLSSNFPSIRVFSNESVLLFRWPKYWNFGKYSILPMNIQDRFPLKLSRASVPGCNSIQGCIILMWL